MTSLLENTPRGLYCPPGNFYIDPWQPVEQAVITHAHSDHARFGSASYLAAETGVNVLRERIGREASIQGLEFGEPIGVNGVRVSLHPAGHILGSAQVRLEQGGEVCVISGDYKTEADPTCAAFEPIRCHTLVSESTFGLPIYRWRPSQEIFDDVNAWWQANQQRRRSCVIFAYALGKAQRILAGVNAEIGPILVHGAVARFLPVYEAAGVELPKAERVTPEILKQTRGQALIIAPPSAAGTPWLRKFGPVSTALASGWMQIRGARRRRAVDRGFVLSDHADFNGLNQAIEATEAEEIWVTHGYVDVMVRWLEQKGKQAIGVATRFEGETDDLDKELNQEHELNADNPSPDDGPTPASSPLE